MGQKVTLEDFRREMHDRFLNAQSIDRTINHMWFEDEWEQMTDEIKESVVAGARAGNRREVRLCIKASRSVRYGELSMEELRDVAKSRGIPGYSRMFRIELIKSLEDA